MIDVLPTVLVVAALAGAALAVLLLVIDRPVGMLLLSYLAVVELGLLALTVTGFVSLAVTDRAVDGLSFGAYLVGILFVLPVGAAWAWLERSRWSSGVLVVACLAVPVMIVRMDQLWTATGG